MRILIVGAERLGRRLEAELVHAGHDVRVLDHREVDPLDRSTLSGAADGCDAIACVSGDDNLNAVLALAARRELDLPLAVAVVSSPPRAEALSGLGAQIVCPTTRTAHALYLALIRSGIETELTLGAGVAVYRVEVPPRLAGRSLAELSRSGELIPVAVERRLDVILPSEHLLLEEGDALHVAAAHRDLISEIARP